MDVSLDVFLEERITDYLDRKSELERLRDTSLAMAQKYYDFADEYQAKIDKVDEDFGALMRASVDVSLMRETKTQFKYRVPSADIVIKKEHLQMQVNNKETWLRWVKANHPERIKVTESVDWSGIKGELDSSVEGIVFDADGQVADGITSEVVPEKIEIKRR